MILQEEELTFGCGEGGTLIKCMFCFNVAHSSCCGLGDQRVNAPQGDWACPACIDHARAQLKETPVHGGEDVGGSGDDVEESEESEESEDDPLDIVEIKDPTTTCTMLRTECCRLGLVQRGSKTQLVSRLLKYHDRQIEDLV